MINSKFLKRVKFCAFADEAGDSLISQINALKRNNISYLELRSIDGKNVSDFTLEEAKNYKKVLDDNKIKVFTIGSPLGKVDIDVDFEEYKKKIEHTFKIANIFEAKYVRVFSFFNAYDKQSLVISYLKEMVKIAKKYDLILCHENEKEIFGDKIERIQIIKNNVEGLEYIFDPSNFIQVDEDIDKAIEEIAPFVTYLHIKDCIK